MAGLVRVGTRIVKKSSEIYSKDTPFLVTGQKKYVSRGGEKLEGAVRHFGIECRAKTCIDVGCSTGGFTDCLLKEGAEKVYAVDVGYGQIAVELRNDKRVVLIEKTNARYLQASDFFDKMDLAVIDVSFISLDKILPAIFPLMQLKGRVLALVKPQFEAGRKDVSKGVVKDDTIRLKAVRRISDVASSLGWSSSNPYCSPLKGPAGNVEYFIYLQRADGL